MRSWAFFAALAIFGFTSSAAQAQGWFGPYGYGYGYGYGVYMHERVPQYALFPPVYYSRPTPRPYGYSPFAYPPGVMTPSRSAVSRSAVVVLNPYTPQPQPKPIQNIENKRPEPMVIHNPFVRAETLTAKAGP